MVKKGKYENTIEVVLTEKEHPILFKKKLEELIEQKTFNSETEAKKWIESTPIVLCLVYHKHSGMFAVEDEAVDSTVSPYDGKTDTFDLNEDPKSDLELCQPIMKDTQNVPEELYDWMVFPDEDTLVLYMQSKGYSEDAYTIQFVSEGDIEDYTIIDEEGNSVRSANTEEDLDDAYNELVSLIPEDGVVFEKPVTLYSNDFALYGSGYSDERYKVTKLERDYITKLDGEMRPLHALQDVDDYCALIHAVKGE